MSATATQQPRAEEEKPRKVEAANERQRELVRSIPVGFPVLYYEAERPRETTRPFAAVVVGKGDASLSLAVFDDSPHRQFYKKVDGVKHFRDPTLNNYEVEEVGCFQVAPVFERLLKLQ